MIDHLPTRKMGHFRPTLILGTILWRQFPSTLVWTYVINIGENAYVSYILLVCCSQSWIFLEQSSAGYDRRYERKEQLKFNQKGLHT